MLKKYDTIGIDCIAMNVNDMICIGATPISFVDYIAANKNNQQIFKKVVQGLAKGAKKAKVPIVGGETAIMPDLFSGKGFTMDLAGTVVGILSKKEMVLGKSIRAGDTVIGIKSSGLHSNGYTLARKVLLAKYKLSDRINGIGNLGSSMLTPTEIYVKPVLEALSKCQIHGLAHITGGSFTKLLRLKNIGFDLTNLPKPPPLMQLIQDCGVENKEMYRTFNMGIGFCVVSPKNNVTKIQNIFKKHRLTSYEIGKIISKKGVFINSKKIA
jgi:phosphoribosylformylglycinamidine cyclo-ligase